MNKHVKQMRNNVAIRDYEVEILEAKGAMWIPLHDNKVQLDHDLIKNLGFMSYQMLQPKKAQTEDQFSIKDFVDIETPEAPKITEADKLFQYRQFAIECLVYNMSNEFLTQMRNDVNTRDQAFQQLEEILYTKINFNNGHTTA